MIQDCAGCGGDVVFDVMHDRSLEQYARYEHYPSQET